jgi:hypothetical protein
MFKIHLGFTVSQIHLTNKKEGCQLDLASYPSVCGDDVLFIESLYAYVLQEPLSQEQYSKAHLQK